MHDGMVFRYPEFGGNFLTVFEVIAKNVWLTFCGHMPTSPTTPCFTTSGSKKNSDFQQYLTMISIKQLIFQSFPYDSSF